MTQQPTDLGPLLDLLARFDGDVEALVEAATRPASSAGKAAVAFKSASEVMTAFGLKLISKQEARKLLGLSDRRPRARA
jgi:hypothetical protein